jgi:hypothetical protein
MEGTCKRCKEVMEGKVREDIRKEGTEGKRKGRKGRKERREGETGRECEGRKGK